MFVCGRRSLMNSFSSSRSSRLRIGVPANVEQIPRGTGHGNVWSQTLRALEQLPDLELERLVPNEDAPQPGIWLADGHGQPLATSAPVVAVVHEAGWNSEFLRSLIKPDFLAMIDRQTARCCRAAAAVIAPSASSRAQVIDLYGLAEDSVHVVPYGVDHDIFRPGVLGAKELIASAGGDPERPYLLWVSQLNPRKNHAVVRAALDELAMRGFPHQLVLVPGFPVEEVEDRSARVEASAPLPRSGREVVILEAPNDRELAALMGAAAALAQPSFMEGFGMTVLEAMACGAPVVVSDRGSLPEVVGEAGLVVPPTAEALTEALARLWSDSDFARTLGAQAQVRARNFTWRRTAEGWRAVLRQVRGS